MYARNTDESLIREAVREILRSSEVSRSPALRRTLVTESRVSDWQLAQMYAFGGRGLLTESQNYRAKILMESLIGGLASAVSWVGGKASQGLSYLRQVGEDAVEGAGKVLTAVLKQIPKGEEIFDLLKDFSQDIGTKIGEAVADSVDELANFINEGKDKFIDLIFGSSIEAGVISKIEQIKEKALKSLEKAQDKANKVKEFFELVIKGQGSKAMVLLQSERAILGSIAKFVIKVIIDLSETVKQKIVQVGMRWFGSNIKGQFLRALITVLGADAGSEGTLDAAIDLMKAGNKLANGVSITLERGSEAAEKILKIFPEIVYGVISGDNITEILARVGLNSDPKAVVKLVQKGISQVVNIVKKYLGDNIKKYLPRAGVDPDSKTGKAIMMGLSAILGLAKGALTDKNYRED